MCAVKPLVLLAVWQVMGHPALILSSVLLPNLAKHFTHMKLQVQVCTFPFLPMFFQMIQYCCWTGEGLGCDSGKLCPALLVAVRRGLDIAYILLGCITTAPQGTLCTLGSDTLQSWKS